MAIYDLHPFLEAFTGLVAAIGLIGWTRWAIMYKHHARLWAIAPLWYLAQLFIFSILTFFFQQKVELVLLSFISTVLHFEGVIVISGSALIMGFLYGKRLRDA